MDDTRRRMNLAEEIVGSYGRQMGEHLVAAACYGSVAHGQADAHSDLELIVLTDASIEAVNVHMVQHGIQVECEGKTYVERTDLVQLIEDEFKVSLVVEESPDVDEIISIGEDPDVLRQIRMSQQDREHGRVFGQEDGLTYLRERIQGAERG